MLGRANFLALVGGGRSPKYPQNKVIIWDDAQRKPVISMEFHSAVRAVRLTRTRIVVVLLGHVHVYAFSSPPTRLHVFETHDNPLGLVAISAFTLVFPGRTPGHAVKVRRSIQLSRRTAGCCGSWLPRAPSSSPAHRV